MHKDDGFSLLEVLLATFLTMMVLMVSMQAFTSALDANNAVDLMAGTNQNLQVAGELLTDDLVKAGQEITPGGIGLPAGTGATRINRPGAPGLLFPNVPVLYAVTPGEGLGPRISPPNPDAPESEIRTDIITVVYGDRTLPELSMSHKEGTSPTMVTVTEVNATGSEMTVYYDPDGDSENETGTQINTTPANRVSVGDVFLISAGGNSSLQEVTAVDGQRLIFTPGGGVMNLNQPGAATGGILSLRTGPIANPWPPTTAQRINIVTYYVDNSNRDLPILMRQVSGRAPVPVALGMENLQFIYSLLTGGTTFEERFNIVAPFTPNDVRKVSVFLGARSDVPTRSTKHYVRNTLVTQANIRSLGFEDIYPGTVD